MTSESGTGESGFGRWPGAVPTILAQMFRPPPRFAPGVEAEFRVESEARAGPARQTAMVLLLLMWVSYFGWDSFHAYRNQLFREGVDTLFQLRLAGTACIVLTGVALLLWRGNRAAGTAALSFCLAALYLLSLGMIAVTAFPFNYLFYFICLPLILLFMFGLFRVESRLVYALTAFCLAASFLFLLFTETTEDASPKNLVEYLSKSLSYYNVAALIFLASFSLIGCAVAVELERSGRQAFARERQLSEKNARLAASRRDIRAKTSALVKAKDELRGLAERQNVAKSKFLADAAHDLRQPMQALTNLLGAARHALDSGDAGKCDALLAMAQDASRLTRASFNAVLDISRLESGFVEAEYSTFDLPVLLDEVAAPFLAAAAERGIEMRLRWNRGRRILVRSDRHLLGRVVANLLSNAVKYSDPARAGAGVVLGIVCLPSRVRIDVVDNGVGIAESDWAKVFSPFVQLDNQERDREKGVGLGLSIVNAIVTLLGEHRLDMRSRKGVGTRFSLELPLGEAAAAAGLSVEVTRPPGPIDLSGLYAFYVEDDPLVRASTVALLDALSVRHEAFGSVADLEAALPAIERDPDLLISDYRLPDGRTAEDAAAAVEQALGAAPPLLVVTGEMSSLAEGPWLGTGAILRKPVSPEALVGAISALCLRQAEAREPGSPGATPRSAARSAEPL
jgi:signal transduction histidine kinase/CheY-like chemotaxis protein